MTEAFEEGEDEKGYVSVSVATYSSDSDNDDSAPDNRERVMGLLMSPENMPSLASNPFFSLEASTISLDMLNSSIMNSSSIMECEVIKPWWHWAGQTDH